MQKPHYKTQFIAIPTDIANVIRQDLSPNAEIATVCEKYKSYDTVDTFTARFPNNIEMDIKFCVGDVKDTSSNPLWMEAVLFHDGCEVATSEVFDEPMTCYELEYENVTYRTIVDWDYVKHQNAKSKLPDKTRLFFDMDGVLNIFSGNIGFPDYHREKPIHQLEHYFQTLEPNVQMQSFIATLYPSTESYLVSHTTEMDPELALQHTYDKQIQLEWNYPNVFSIDHKIFIPNQSVIKPLAVYDTLGYILHETDVLIDDYNKNLVEWQKAGGTAIKYINEHNNPESFEGFCISPDMDIIEIYEVIRYAIQTQKRQNDISESQKIIRLKDMHNETVDILQILNYNDSFKETLYQIIEKWNDLDEEPTFDDYVYSELRRAGYHFKILDYKEQIISW